MSFPSENVSPHLDLKGIAVSKLLALKEGKTYIEACRKSGSTILMIFYPCAPEGIVAIHDSDFGFSSCAALVGRDAEGFG